LHGGVQNFYYRASRAKASQLNQRLDEVSGFRFADALPGCAHSYLLPVIERELDSIPWQRSEKRIVDVGCGNGSVAGFLQKKGYSVVGVDASIEGIGLATRQYPDVSFVHGSVYDNLSSTMGRFPVAICLEVIEHLYAPRLLVKTLADLLEPGGKLILSTPYHGYFKNVALALSGKMDQHFTALWDHGHIKFWSPQTLTTIFREGLFEDIRIHRVGRIPPLAKSMVMVATRAGTEPARGAAAG
jgi:2-polyprenyl-6-hydroxyphenyl methylase/3-demethylubiquinone-9 3-methyltransferase